MKRITKHTKKKLYMKMSHPLLQYEYNSSDKLYESNKIVLDEFSSEQLWKMLNCPEPMLLTEADLKWVMPVEIEGYKAASSKTNYLTMLNKSHLYWFNKIVEVELEQRKDWQRDKKIKQLLGE